MDAAKWLAAAALKRAKRKPLTLSQVIREPTTTRIYEPAPVVHHDDGSNAIALHAARSVATRAIQQSLDAARQSDSASSTSDRARVIADTASSIAHEALDAAQTGVTTTFNFTGYEEDL